MHLILFARPLLLREPKKRDGKDSNNAKEDYVWHEASRQAIRSSKPNTDCKT